MRYWCMSVFWQYETLIGFSTFQHYRIIVHTFFRVLLLCNLDSDGKLLRTNAVHHLVQDEHVVNKHILRQYNLSLA